MKNIKIKYLLVIVMTISMSTLTAWAHRDNDPTTNLVKMAGVVITSNGEYNERYGAVWAIANIDRVGSPPTLVYDMAFHSTERSGPSDLVKLTITFPHAVTFDRIAWNSAGQVFPSDSVWSAYLDNVQIVAPKSCDHTGVNGTWNHEPFGDLPVGGQHEKAIFDTPKTGTVLRLEFTPKSHAGGWYWGVQDINVKNGAWPAIICVTPSTYDLTGDCIIDLKDFAVLASNWLVSN